MNFFLGIFTGLLVGKLFGVVQLSWWFILAPIWIPFMLVFWAIAIVLLIGLIEKIK